MTERNEDLAELRKLSRSLAIDAHKAHAARSGQLFASVISNGAEALKASILMNAGSAGAILAFLSQIVTKPAPNPMMISYARYALAFFGIGVLTAAISFALAYATQHRYANAMHAEQFVWEHPYVQKTPKSIRKHRQGMMFQVLGITFAILSYIAALAGFWFAWKALASF